MKHSHPSPVFPVTDSQGCATSFCPGAKGWARTTVRTATSRLPRKRLGKGVCVLLGLLLSTGLSTPALAHSFTVTETHLEVERAPGLNLATGFVVSMQLDLDALALGVAPSADNDRLYEAFEAMEPQERLVKQKVVEDFLTRRIRVYIDEEPVSFSVELPQVDNGREEPPSWLGTQAILRGSIASSAQNISFRASRSLPAVQLKAQSGDLLLFTGLLEKGTKSPLVDLTELPQTPATSPVARYVKIGFEHIVPSGLDHVLFVLGLVLALPSWRALLAQVTGFTLAHSVTLGLAAAGWVRFPSSWVEILIAASIVFVAVENLMKKRAAKTRFFVVLAFGLLHGLGFAGAFKDLLPQSTGWLLALFGFNVGVELGQLSVVLVALGVVLGLKRAQPTWTQGLSTAGSVAIGLTGLFWTIERIVGLATGTG